MACFRKICGKKKKRKEPPADHIIHQLQETETILIKQAEDLEKEIEDCITIAKANATTNKRASMRALQKKNRLVKNLEHVDYTLTTLEIQRDALQNAKTNAKILSSMKSVGLALKKANVKLDSNRVQTLMDDISEQHYVGNEISTAIRKSLVSEVDEEELAKELEKLEVVELDKKKSEEKPVFKFPSIPIELDIIFTDKKEEEANQNETLLGNTAKEEVP